ncbi:MAG: aminoglycoside 6-adenylyltransferase [Spirochaetaceae bacterium]|jgi:aminoglycoside 6-adenylyltransferase|nr:aminoglycoside 6-adenylyltransferase [Spirochaetaceae bacterium]
MRSETEMMNLILDYARNDERIRAATIEGSRMNKNAPQDQFQDYDVSYIVNDIESFKKDDAWLDYFGPRLIMQKPEAMALFPPELGNRFSYLMLYDDENRIDLTLVPITDLPEHFNETDSLTKVVLDKDGICPKLEPPSDKDYLVKKPSAEFVDDCCNEFWWLSSYVTKGLCRNEILYAIKYLDLMRNQMFNMISWKVGIETNFSVSVGKANKYLQKYVSEELWQNILKTYSNDTSENVWRAMIISCNIFMDATDFVCKKLNYSIPVYSVNMLKYIKKYAELESVEREE